MELVKAAVKVVAADVVVEVAAALLVPVLPAEPRLRRLPLPHPHRRPFHRPLPARFSRIGCSTLKPMPRTARAQP